MSLKQEALIHRVYRHCRYANLKHQSINQVTVASRLQLQSTYSYNYTLYLYTKLHSHESGPGCRFLKFRDLNYLVSIAVHRWTS